MLQRSHSDRRPPRRSPIIGSGRATGAPGSGSGRAVRGRDVNSGVAIVGLDGSRTGATAVRVDGSIEVIVARDGCGTGAIATRGAVDTGGFAGLKGRGHVDIVPTGATSKR